MKATTTKTMAKALNNYLKDHPHYCIEEITYCEMPYSKMQARMATYFTFGCDNRYNKEGYLLANFFVITYKPEFYACDGYCNKSEMHSICVQAKKNNTITFEDFAEAFLERFSI